MSMLTEAEKQQMHARIEDERNRQQQAVSETAVRAEGLTMSQASRAQRLGACLVNMAIYFAPGIPILVIWGPDVVEVPANDWIIAVYGIYISSIMIIQIILLSVQGQDLGKKILKIQIVKRSTGRNGGFVTNVLLRRFLNGLIGVFFPFYILIDTLWIFGSEKLCVHDHLAGTTVVSL